MVGSSMRNAIRRRNHKERSQPVYRQKLGFLEKHKDYVQRAKDYHSKQDRLKKLREKAEFRNKDEFYFGMVGKKTSQGQHFQDRGNEPLPNDLVRVLKTQDAGYIHMHRAMNSKKIDKVKTTLGSLINTRNLINEDYRFELGLNDEQESVLQRLGYLPSDNTSSKKKNKSYSHVVFANDDDKPYDNDLNDISDLNDNKEEDLDVDLDLGWKDNKKKKNRRNLQNEMDNDQSVFENDGDNLELSGEKRLKKCLNELTARISRQDALDRAARELELTKALMGKGSKQKLESGQKTSIEDGEQPGREGKPRVFKWRAERKK